MTAALLTLSARDIQEVALALRSGRLAPPFSAVALQRIIAGEVAQRLADDLQTLVASGFGAEQIATTLELVRTDRLTRPRIEDVLELVTTGPEVPTAANRDTSVIVRELFANANHSVLVAGYAVYQGQRVFQTLANRMQDVPTLHVRLFLDIQRGHGDTTASAALIRRFAERFRHSQWPKDRPLPEVYFDPRSLDSAQQRACLHAKCVVVDGRQVFVSSANFTEAAQLRNIEVGVSLDAEPIAWRLTEFFDSMLRANSLIPVRIVW